MRLLLTGNEAIARGAWEGGVTAAFGYPGTPSTEILENLVRYDGVYCEWSPNEKVALEAAAGASIGGARTIVTMKLVGLNVASDPLMTLSYVGVRGGLVVCVADDPGQHSSQTEQDTRHYARLAKVPILDPADAVDARAFMLEAFELSEKYGCPVILRTTTCVGHSRALVECGEARARNVTEFKKEPSRFVPLPLWGRKLRVKVEERIDAQSLDASAHDSLNTVIPASEAPANGRPALGIVTCGITALYCRELMPEAAILKLGWPWPFPDDLIHKFASSVDKLVVIEEGDPILEEHIRSLGIACTGKSEGLVPRCGELTPDRIFEIREKLRGTGNALPKPFPQAEGLPMRPPVFCAGCPHRALFYALTKFDVIVTGDIGCYSLAVFPPLERTDVLICMGGGFTLAHGLDKAGEKKKVVGVLGDSTFFHSGITGLLDVVYNGGASTLIVVDNSSTAMTGHQDHPGTGRTISGAPAPAASIEAIARACGMKRVSVCDPFDQKRLHDVLAEEIASDEPSLIISKAPCPLQIRRRLGPVRTIDPDRCKRCGACLKCGCPAIVLTEHGGKPSIDPQLCAGCRLCESLCKFGAIAQVKESGASAS